MSDGEQTTWWDEIADDRSADYRKAEKLANLLERYEGARAAKVIWLVAEIPLLEQEAATRFDPETERRKFGAEVARLAIRFWRHRLARASSGGTSLTPARTARQNFDEEANDRIRERLRVVGEDV